MSRLRVVVAAALLVLATGLTPAIAAPGAIAPVSGRAYDASALAVPIDPEAGSHGSPIPARLFTTRADVSNPPRSASGRAARTDLGLLEQFVPQQALGPAADASTRDRGSRRNARTTDGSAVYVAHADRSPAASATATAAGAHSGALSIGGVRSTSAAREVGSQLVATADTTMSSLTIGPLTAGAASYHAVATVNGRHGGARAMGLVTVSAATVAGVPVVVTPDGVQIDSTRVPTNAVQQAAAGVAEAFARSGYLDVRLVQPAASRKADGSAASVNGGGLQLIGRSDANQTYFIATTLLSGEVSVATGDSLAGLRLPVTSTPGSAPPPATADVGPPFTPSTPGRGGAVVSNAGQPPRVSPLYSRSAGDVRLAQTWTGWPVLLGIVVAMLVIGLAFRRRVSSLLNAAADRYVRG